MLIEENKGSVNDRECKSKKNNSLVTRNSGSVGVGVGVKYNYRRKSPYVSAIRTGPDETAG